MTWMAGLWPLSTRAAPEIVPPVPTLATKWVAKAADFQIIGSEIVAPLGNTMRFVDHQQRDPEGTQQLEKPLMLHPFRRQIEQLKPFLIEILNDAVLFRPGEAGMKSRRCDLPLLQAGDLILHQRNERGDDQGQSWQEGRRQLVAE